MSRVNAIRNSLGKNITGNLNAYVFAAVLIICSITVGCSSDKPKPATSSHQMPETQLPAAPAPMPATAPVMQAEKKPAAKKVVRRRPATVNYADKTYGVTFEYPRRYAIETGDSATQLVASTPLPMNFVQPGGVALAAVELPETGYDNTDFSSAFFNVSVNKLLTADQCSEFAVPQPKSAAPSDPAPSTEVAKLDSTQKSDSQVQSASSADPKSDVNPNSKLLIGDMELRATEAVSGEGTRQSDSKFFHVYQNGACYEFALNLTTDASDKGLVKHVNRDRVFNRLEQILATVKISPVTPDATAGNLAPAPTLAATPAQ